MKQLRKASGFYKKSLLFTALSGIAAILNYALYPLLVRIIGPSQFGDFATVLALSNQLLVVLTCVNIVLIYVKNKYGEESSASYAAAIQRYALIGYAFLGSLLVLFSPFIKNILSIESYFSFVILFLTLVAAIPALVWTGQLHGNKELVRISVYTLVSSLSRLLIALILARYWGVEGAVSGILIGLVIGLVVLKLYPGKKLTSPLEAFKSDNSDHFKPVKKLFWSAAGTVTLLGLLQNIDILLSKVLYTPEIAGLYSSISVLSNAIYFASFLLIWIVLPEFKIDSKQNNHRLLRTAYSLILVIFLSVCIIGTLFRTVVLEKLLKVPIDSETLLLACTYQTILVSSALYCYYKLSQAKASAVLLPTSILVSIFSLILFINPPDTRSLIKGIVMSTVMGVLIYVCILFLINRKKPVRQV